MILEIGHESVTIVDATLHSLFENLKRWRSPRGELGARGLDPSQPAVTLRAQQCGTTLRVVSSRLGEPCHIGPSEEGFLELS